MPMPKTRALALLLTALLAPPWLGAAQQIHRCTIDGTVTYQSVPCPSGSTRAAPTVQQLNAERQKRLRQAAAAASASPMPAPAVVATTATRPAVAAPRPAATGAGAYRCDGRLHCSQMRSCAEARYFLQNCPGVTMDGDHDGIPCETQWCH